MTTNTADNRYSCSNFIVAPTIGEGANYTTIAAALADASSGETVFVKPGTYTENFTLKAGVDIIAFVGDLDEPNVILVGQVLFSSLGTAALKGMKLRTNSKPFLYVSGSARTEVKLVDCYLQCNNGDGMYFNSTNSGSLISIKNCKCFLNTGGNILFSLASAGRIVGDSVSVYSPISYSDPSVSTSGSLFFRNSKFEMPFVVEGSSSLVLENSSISNSTVCITGSGSGSTPSTPKVSLNNVLINTKNPRNGAITISANSHVRLSGECDIRTDGVSAITGDGTMIYTPTTFSANTPISIKTKTPIAIGPDVLVKNDILPVGDKAGDIGSATNAWKKLFVGGLDFTTSEFVLGSVDSSGTTNLMEAKSSYVKFISPRLEARTSAVGSDVGIGAVNTEKTNALSSAVIAAGTMGSSSGDPYFQLDIEGFATNKFGLDNSDSDIFKYFISSNAGLAGLEGVEALNMTQAGEFTYPLQPAFCAVLDRNRNNVTGNGAIYSIIFDNVLFDNGSDFNLGSSIFQAPVAGKYQFNARLSLLYTRKLTTLIIRISTSNLTYIMYNKFEPVSGGTGIGIDQLIYLDAGDTAYIRVQGRGEDGNTDELFGSSEKYTSFSGFLVA